MLLPSCLTAYMISVTELIQEKNSCTKACSANAAMLSRSHVPFFALLHIDAASKDYLQQAPEY